jgi:Uma2 family endonuclease
MIANFQPNYLTPEEYLQWEEEQSIKHEYINGEVYAMVGGTLNHNYITLNLASALRNNQRGKGCKVYMADAKLGISQQGPFFYPDIMITCDSRDKKQSKIIYHPLVIIEVLSPSTEAFDRGDKFKFYRQIDTLKEYVLIDSKKINIDCFRLNENNFWELHFYQENDELELNTISFSCPISLIYEDINFCLVNY